MNRPGVGVALIVVKGDSVIMFRRICEHGYGLWSFPGGHLELMEDWDACAIREFKEEISPHISITPPKFLTVVNAKFPHENKHYVTIFMGSFWNYGDLPQYSMEPTKHEPPQWVKIDSLPTPLMPGIKYLVDIGTKINMINTKCRTI